MHHAIVLLAKISAKRKGDFLKPYGKICKGLKPYLQHECMMQIFSEKKGNLIYNHRKILFLQRHSRCIALRRAKVVFADAIHRKDIIGRTYANTLLT